MAQLSELICSGVARMLSKLYVNDSVTAPKFIGNLQGNADTATKVNGHTVNSDVPANAKFTDTWRGIQDNLTSDSSTDSLSAKQGKSLKTLVDEKSPKNHTHSKDSIGLSNVENKSSATIRNEITKENIIAALGYEPGSDADGNIIQKPAAVIENITIPSSGFVLQTDGSYLYVLSNNQVNSNSIVDAYFSKECQKIGSKAHISITSETGKINFHAVKPPKETLFIETLRILSPTQDDSFNESYNTELAMLQNPTFEDYSITSYNESFSTSVNKISSGNIFTKILEGIKGSLLNLQNQINSCNSSYKNISSNVSNLSQNLDTTNKKFSEYLPLVGGTLSGNIEVKDYIRIKDTGNFYSAVCDFLTSTELRSTKNDGTYTALILFNADSTSGTCIKYRVSTSGSSKDYALYGEHNYQDIKIGKVLKMHDGVNVRTVIQCLDDGDEYDYGSEVIFGGGGNTYLGAGESPTNLHNTLATSNGETLYISSDNSINFYSNCNTIENRKCLSFTSAALFPYTNGSFTLGTSSAKWGQIYSTASSISTSDRNQKHDIKELPESQAHNLIFGLNPVIYKYNDGTSNRRHWGLIAQDVEELMESIHLDSSDFAGFIKSPREKLKDEKTGEFELDLDEDGNLQYDYALRYEEFIAPLIKVVQEQQKEIDNLKKLLSNI